MEEVTDFSFREMFARYSKTVSTSPALPPSLKLRRAGRASSPCLGEGNNGAGASLVMFTEFINVDGLTHPEGRKNLAIDLKYSEAQRPIVAQLWGSSPEKFYQAAQIIRELKFDGLDINMGCPQQKEIQGGACAALIREPKLAQEIISATKEGWLAGKLSRTPTPPSRYARHLPLTGEEAPRLSEQARSSPPVKGEYPAKQGEGVGVPISVKTRIGYSKPDEMGKWVENLLEAGIAALILHGRTKQEMSKVPAHWDKIKEAVKIRDKRQGKRDKDNRTLIIGNGDIKSYQAGLNRITETGCDGVMIGRGAFGHPWLFRADNYQPNVKERLRAMLEHAEMFDQELGKVKSFAIMRKHFKAYCSGFPGAHELRAKLMETKNLEETKSLVEEYLIYRINE